MSPDPRRLALFLPDMSGGGAEQVALALARAFVAHGHPVDLVLVNRRGPLLPLLPPEVEIVDLKAPSLRRALLPLAAYLRRRRPGAIHAMMWPLPLLAVVARAIARADTRTIGSEHTTLSTRPHGLRHRWVRLLTRWAYARLDALVAVSAGVAADLSAFLGVARERTVVIHNPLLLPAILPAPRRAAGHWPAGTTRILAVGTLKPEKNYPLLLRALARVRERGAATLVILGDGPLRAVLERQVDEAGLRDAVTFAGFTTDPWPFYAAADVFVLCSDFEGFGNVLVEALYAGVPVVSTDCPNGPREILDGGRYGLLVPCRDERALADALIAAGSRSDAEARRRRAVDLSGSGSADRHLGLMLGRMDGRDGQTAADR